MAGEARNGRSIRPGWPDQPAQFTALNDDIVPNGGNGLRTTSITDRRVHIDTGYSPLLERAGLLWPELEAETGHEILTRCGGLSIGARDGEYLPELLASATANGTRSNSSTTTNSPSATRSTGCGRTIARCSIRERASSAPIAR
ncbi:hypothetical protein [Amycolatopsis sp. DG1A-15b]|uniref:hypothetical protein n=1 Tax=Amycolatopsis sp. DG1A-15b TaxID=3052846 RepID=UPI00255B490E|nr:hypothetical protein [Amycolatopsis sp. DG1A-15b]WIX92439.1 hypothetical protein QRY02_19160 [Amycolatopsis sp. DG1A-15b]